MGTVVPSVFALKTKRVWGILLLFVPQVLEALGYSLPESIPSGLNGIFEGAWALGALVLAFWGANKAHLRKIHWFGDTGPMFRGLIGPAFMVSAALGLGACGAGALIKETRTPEEKAGAFVLIFDSYQEGVMQLVENPSVPDKEKKVLRDANRIGSKAARALKHARADYVKIEGEVRVLWDKGETPDITALQTLEILGNALADSLEENGPTLTKFQKTMLRHNVTKMEPLLAPAA